MENKRNHKHCTIVFTQRKNGTTLDKELPSNADLEIDEKERGWYGKYRYDRATQKRGKRPDLSVNWGVKKQKKKRTASSSKIENTQRRDCKITKTLLWRRNEGTRGAWTLRKRNAYNRHIRLSI